MESIKLTISLYGRYIYSCVLNEAMVILVDFLLSDVRCNYPSGFREWALNDEWDGPCSGNLTRLEKEGDDILLTALYSEEEVPTELKMTREQFVQIFDDWREKVCRFKPREVIIQYENDEFSIETKD